MSGRIFLKFAIDEAPTLHLQLDLLVPRNAPPGLLASRASSNTIVSVAIRKPHRLVFFVRSLGVAWVDSTGLVVPIGTQWVAGRS